ncbi:hypothetical protein LINPERPRIM_LOCUS16877 [Linum perenne]
MRDRVWQRLRSWVGRRISTGGREVLIKRVAQAIPIYCINVFLLSNTITNDIQKMMNSFWWGMRSDGSRGIS